jgi:putative heme-binding domain-containing protein
MSRIMNVPSLPLWALCLRQEAPGGSRGIGDTIRVAILLILAVTSSTPAARANEPRPLFDGSSLAGWDVRGGEEKWWRAAEGMIVGGSLEENVPHNTFLSTKDSFGNFELRFKIRVRGAGGFVNSGIQIRSTRVPKSHEMSGYQVDAGPGWWGKLYDESRRNKVIGEPKDPQALAAAIKEGDWNDYTIRAEGPRIRSWINGVAALDFVEPDATIPLDGQIGLQVHGGGKALVEVKDIAIERLPATPVGAKLKAGNAAEAVPLSPADEAAAFTLADGFTAELVLAESEDPANPYGKFVALAFDAHGRLWTTTALEYPVDANENPEASRQLFASGGRDKVLVVDDPWAAKPAPPRTFADHLAMPLSVLPYRDGAFVQYGPEVRFYRDADSDGRAEAHETVLEGFGVQDSHLFPHQFTRVPGDWILLAQGLFNTSQVRRPGNAAFADGSTEIRFDACKLARFKPDGSMFESVTAGPNNIWGLTISRTGETWLQEANDIGYPLFPYEPGVLVATGSPDRLRPYQPLMPPPLAPPQMGGSGLSGLALADDLDGWPAPWGAGTGYNPDERIFYLANPITNSIQTVIATRSGERFTYRKGPDLLASADKAFRPVAIQFGPDGCLYVIDWYNKVISHNEVPRNHPDRDRVRGRIWRIRHSSQPVREPIDIAKVPTADLPRHLSAKNNRLADLAWQEIVDRDAKSLLPELARLAADAKAPTEARIGALWALEGLGGAATPLLEKLVADPSADLRHEAIRIAAAACPEADFRRLAESLVDDPSPRVRAALGDALRRIPVTAPETTALLVRFGRGPVQGDAWTVYDREFERYLARWALERNAAQVAAFLGSPAGRELPVENRLLALLALEPAVAAQALVTMLPDLGRPPDAQEIRLLAQQAAIPAVAAALERLVLAPETRPAALAALLAQRTSLDATVLEPIMSQAAATLLAAGASPTDRTLGLEVAGAFSIKSLAPQVSTLALDGEAGGDIRRAAIRCLRELGAMSGDTGRAALAAAGADRALRAEAIAAWAASRDPAACAALVAAWDDLDFAERQAAAAALARQREGAAALVAAMADDSIDAGSLPIGTVADMRAVLGADAALEKIWNDLTAGATAVLRLAGGDADSAAEVNLEGPFTVEAWVNLESPISNQDSLLAADGVLDMNFFAEQFRVWIKPFHDVLVARRKAVPGTWTHYAVTRDAEGSLKLYVNGELDCEATVRDTTPYRGLRIGYSTPKGAGTQGRVAEFRVWDRARTADELRADFDRSYAGDGTRPPSLVTFHGGSSWGELAGQARVEPALDAPRLVTTADVQARAEKFARFRALADAGGDAARGRTLFATKCLTCHQQGGEGGKIGPALDGLGLTGVEAILRHVLTPSAAMEGGYRSFRVVTRDGRVIQGLLVSRDADAIVIRQPDVADIRIAAKDVSQADFTGISVMPEGLLE